MTMSRSQAIREARAQVALIGPMAQALPGGNAAYRVNVYDAGYGAWTEGRVTGYASARAQYKAAVVGRALALMGWDSWDVEGALSRSWEWQGRGVAQVIRDLTA